MNKNFSEEIIEIDNKEYTLFLNRTGIVLWEKTTKIGEFGKLLANKYKDIDVFEKEKEFQVNDNTTLGELIGSEIDILDEDEEKLRESIYTFYWIALDKHHKMTFAKAKELMEKAEFGTYTETGEPNNDAYGLEQLSQLMVQMLEDANTSKQQDNNLKNLKALKSTKK